MIAGVLARYDVNGTLDSTFDTDGKLTIDFFESRDGEATGIGGNSWIIRRQE